METDRIALAIAAVMSDETRFLIEEMTRQADSLRQDRDEKAREADSLRQDRDEKAREADSLRKERDELREKVEELVERNRLLLRILHGRKAEIRPPREERAQPLLPFDEAEAEGEKPPVAAEPEPVTTVGSHRRRKPGRRPLPADLPRVECHHDLPESEKVCACGAQKKRIGEEVSERLDIIPAKIQVVRHIREKFACPACQGSAEEGKGAVAIAPMPPQIIDQGIVSAGLLAHVIVAKYADAIPLHRQEQQFLRLGLDIGRGTLANWVLQVAAMCYLLGEFLVEMLLAGPVINMDETPVQVLREPGRANTTRSFMWTARGGPLERPVIVFRYSPTRSGNVPLCLLQGFRGYLQTDGYGGYGLVGQRPGIRHMGCWAHVRRKFFEVVTAARGATKTGVAQDILDRIGKLYAVETEAKDMEPDARKTLRQEKSRPIIEGIKELLDKHEPSIPPRSLLGKAVHYALGQWERLTVYLEDGRLRPDNNLAENAIRPFVVGRKNWLFSGSPRGADASALFYSLIETAKANGLEPYAYLRHLFEELPRATTEKQMRALLPNVIEPEKLRPVP